MIGFFAFLAILGGLGYAVSEYGWLIASALFTAWLLGFFFSLSLMSRIGEASPFTRYDSFSGDDDLDLLLAIGWPVFWPCYAAHMCGQLAFRR